MTKDELIALAKEAGFVPNYGIAPLPIMDYATVGLDPTLERFATLVAAKERDAEISFDNLFDGSNAHLLEEAMSNAPFYIYRPTKPFGATNVSEDALPWVYDQDPSSGFCARMLVVSADALAAADKRVAGLESSWAACHAQLADSCDERYRLERKLAIAVEAMTKAAYLECNGVIRVALAQIGGEDACN